MSKRFFKRLLLHTAQIKAKRDKFWWYAIAVFFKNASTLRVRDTCRNFPPLLSGMCTEEWGTPGNRCCNSWKDQDLLLGFNHAPVSTVGLVLEEWEQSRSGKSYISYPCRTRRPSSHVTFLTLLSTTVQPVFPRSAQQSSLSKWWYGTENKVTGQVYLLSYAERKRHGQTMVTIEKSHPERETTGTSNSNPVN